MKTRFLLIFALSLLSSAAWAADYKGKVLSPAGNPVQNATVYFLAYGNAAPQTAHSDAFGDYHFTNVEQGGQLVATADGFGLGFLRVPSDQPRADISLSNSTDVTLTFESSDNKPQAGIRIFLQQMRLSQSANNGPINPWLQLDNRSPIAAVTDASGVCVFRGLPQGATAIFQIDNDRYATLGFDGQVILATGPKTRPDPIRTFAASTISGKVSYPDGKPAAGIVIVAQPYVGSFRGATTDANGNYTINRLEPGPYVVSLMSDPERQTKWTARAVANVALAAGSAKTGIDLPLTPGVVINGSVVAADDSTPVSGVRIGIYGPAHPREGGYVQTATTDDAGKFTARVPPGDQLVYIISQTPALGFGQPSPDNKHISVAAGATGAVEFRLPRVTSSVIRGKVVDPDGKPVGGASVFASNEEMPMFGRNPTITNADGTFTTIPMLRAGRIEIRARYQDMATPHAIVITRSAQPEVTIQLQKNALGTIAGRVLDGQGKPLQNASVELITQTFRYSYGQNSGFTDAGGNYKIASLFPDSNYLVVVRANGYGQAESPQLHLESGQVTTARDLSLYKKDAKVGGLLVNAENKPQAGQRIEVDGPRTGSVNLTTDHDGKFSCDVVSGEQLTIYYYVGRGYKQQSARAGDEKIVLHIAPARPAPANHAHVVETAPAAARVDQAPTPPPAVSYDPSDALTWNGWLYSAILLVVGGAITVIANTIASFHARNRAKSA